MIELCSESTLLEKETLRLKRAVAFRPLVYADRIVSTFLGRPFSVTSRYTIIQGLIVPASVRERVEP